MQTKLIGLHHDVVAYRALYMGLITASTNFNFFSAFASETIWDDRSETWFKTLCVLNRSKTLVTHSLHRPRCQVEILYTKNSIWKGHLIFPRPIDFARFYSGERLCNGTVSVRPSVWLSRWSITSQQQRAGTPATDSGLSIDIPLPRPRYTMSNRLFIWFVCKMTQILHYGARRLLGIGLWHPRTTMQWRQSRQSLQRYRSMPRVQAHK